jgi:predicted transcriptional regulator
MTTQAMAMSAPVAPDQTPTLALDPRVLGVLRSAGGPVGLNLLLLFGHDPTACDTAQGFAQRIHCPVKEVEQALRALAESGVIRASRGPGDGARISYWLSGSAELFTVLGQIIRMYTQGPEGRRQLFRAFSS